MWVAEIYALISRRNKNTRRLIKIYAGGLGSIYIYVLVDFFFFIAQLKQLKKQILMSLNWNWIER